MIRRDFVKRLSALAAMPILPAFLRRAPTEPVYLGPTDTLIVDADLSEYADPSLGPWTDYDIDDVQWHRYTYQSRAGEPTKWWLDGVRQPDGELVPYTPPLNAKSQRALDEGRTLMTNFWGRIDA